MIEKKASTGKCSICINYYRVEKDNASIKHEIQEIKVISDEVLRAKVQFSAYY